MHIEYRRYESPSKTKGLGWTVVGLLVKILITHSTLSDKTAAANDIDFRYSELQQMNADCYPLDSCKERRLEDTLDEFNCHCGRFCADYDTCCADSKFRYLRLKAKTPSSCVQVYGQPSKKRVFMVDRCAPDWSGDDYVREMCSGDAEALSDPLLLIPFTSSKTRVTYKNFFCATCNGERVNQGTFWNVRMIGSSEYVNSGSSGEVPELMYDSDNGFWRLREFPQSSTVDVHVEIPDSVAPDVKACRRDVISTCAEDWTDDVTRRKCSSYMAIIVASNTDDSSKLYRNVYCAVCNHEVNFETGCRQVKLGGGISPRKGLSFPFLLDINMKHGDIVGKLQRCKSNEKYDVSGKRCRSLSCGIPGLARINGICVRQ